MNKGRSSVTSLSYSFNALFCTFRTFSMKILTLNINQFEDLRPLDGLYVNDFSAHIKANKDLIDKPHRHDFFLCVLFTEGTGTHEIDFHSYDIQPGTVFFLKPGQNHFWKFKTSPKGFIFFHSQAFYEMKFLNHRLSAFPFYYSYQNPPYLDLNSNQLIKTEQLFSQVFQEFKQQQHFRELKIVNLINSIYIDLTRAYTSHINPQKLLPPNYLKTLEHLEHLIDENFYNEKLPVFYAKTLSMTTKHLNRIVKTTIDKTTSELISERIILEAKRLIVHSEGNLSSVADTLEFTDYAYFSKVFKTKTGFTPLKFRKKYIIN